MRQSNRANGLRGNRWSRRARILGAGLLVSTCFGLGGIPAGATASLCSLIPTQQATALLGGPITRGPLPTTTAAADTCNVGAGSVSSLHTLNVTVYKLSASTLFDTLTQGAARSAGAKAATKVLNGLGSRAALVTGGGSASAPGSAAVFVAKGSRMVQVAAVFNPGTGTPSASKLVAVARRILRHIK